MGRIFDKDGQSTLISVLVAMTLTVMLTGCSASQTKPANIHPVPGKSQTSSSTTGTYVGGKVKAINKSLEIDNLNTATNKNTYINLPANWHTTKSTYETAKSFSFNEYKNKDIKQLYTYAIYNEYNVQIGDFEFIGYYSDQPYGAVMPNHSSIIQTAYTGETELGVGTIYVLNSDLPRKERTDKYSTYDQIYAVIPIKNEKLAYMFSLKVPSSDNYSKYVNIMKEMLKSS